MFSGAELEKELLLISIRSALAQVISGALLFRFPENKYVMMWNPQLVLNRLVSLPLGAASQSDSVAMLLGLSSAQRVHSLAAIKISYICLVKDREGILISDQLNPLTSTDVRLPYTLSLFLVPRSALFEPCEFIAFNRRSSLRC